MEDQPGQLHIGARIDPASGAPTGERHEVDARDLTTHGVIVGMTGSGKTGLGIVLLEEALLSGIPVLVLDPKSDMGNLALNFPDLQPGDFLPWVNEGDARRKGLTPAELAAKTAATWREGLASSGIGPERMRKLRDGAEITIYTPGSSAGVPINVLGSLARPGLSWDTHAEALRDEIEGLTSSLLGLAGIEVDPISGREHILVANLVEKAWRDGRDLDLAALIGEVQRPPMRKLGVFELDTFFPERERVGLAMRLNALIASPSFAAWLEGPPIDVARLLRADHDRPGAAIVYLAHLSESERQFIVTLILAKVVTWMRGLSGTTDLRALVYMDEVFGFVPPTANPPAKKPILTLLKQGRAYGVGTVLATQNPVDLDYKAMSNAGTWWIGRLQTERDKLRVLEGLASAQGGVDVGALDGVIGGLEQRRFLQVSTHEPAPALFHTRWAISYLRGPLTREQIAQLRTAGPLEVAPTTPAVSPATAPVAALPGAASGGQAPDVEADHSPVAPVVAKGVAVSYLHPAAAWAPLVGAVPGGRSLEAALVARVGLRFDDASARVDHREEWEAVYFPLTRQLDAGEGTPVDYDARDFEPEAPPGARFVLPDAPVGEASYFKAAREEIRRHLFRTRTAEVFRNPSLKLYSRIGETREAFGARCDGVAEAEADRATAKLKERYADRIERVGDVLRTAERRVEELAADREARGREEWLGGAGALLGTLLGGRGGTRSIASRAARAAGGLSSRHSRTARTVERLESAAEKVADKERELDELEAELADEIAAIDAEWSTKGEDIEAVTIPLELSDVTVDEIALVWVPTA